MDVSYIFSGMVICVIESSIFAIKGWGWGDTCCKRLKKDWLALKLVSIEQFLFYCIHSLMIFSSVAITLLESIRLVIFN